MEAGRARDDWNKHCVHDRLRSLLLARAKAEKRVNKVERLRDAKATTFSGYTRQSQKSGPCRPLQLSFSLHPLACTLWLVREPDQLRGLRRSLGHCEVGPIPFATHSSFSRILHVMPSSSAIPHRPSISEIWERPSARKRFREPLTLMSKEASLSPCQTNTKSKHQCPPLVVSFGHPSLI